MFSERTIVKSGYKNYGAESFFITDRMVYKCFFGIPYKLLASESIRG